jgi:hypothetical protein
MTADRVNENGQTMALLYPNMRDELLAALDSFAIPDLEARGGYEYDGRWVGAEEMVCDLPDDLLAGAPSPAEANKLIGVMLYDEEEAQAISGLLAAVFELLDQLDRPASDTEYVAAPGWRSVVAAAANARTVLGRRN